MDKSLEAVNRHIKKAWMAALWLPFVVTSSVRSFSHVTGEVSQDPDPARSTPQLTSPTLLVDDDDNEPDVRTYYTEALDALGWNYAVWDTLNSDDEPPTSTLSAYDIVIWFSGDEYGGHAGPGPAGEAALSAFLDAGKCLLISSQDYHSDRGLTLFMQTYLGAGSVSDDDGNYARVNGAGSIFSQLGSYRLDYPFLDYSDIVIPDDSAELAFVGNNDNGAAVNSTANLSTFWVFPFEAIETNANRQEVMGVFLDWCTARLQADLSVSKSDAPDPVYVGAPLTYTLTITNAGPHHATSVMLTDTLPGGVIFLDAGPDCAEANGVVTCALGSLAPGDSSLVEILVIAPPQAGLITNQVEVSADQTDPEPINNTASEDTAVEYLPAGVEITPPTQALSGTPSTVVTYTYTLTNTGEYTDSFGIEASGLWTATQSISDTGMLVPQESVTMMLWVEIPVDAPNGASDITMLSAVSTLNPEVSAVVSATTTCSFVLDIDISPPESAMFSTPGNMVTHSFTITNASDVPQTIALAIGGNTWPVTGPTGTGELGPMGSVNVMYTVDIPGQAGARVAATASDTFTLAATGSIGGMAQATGTTQAEVSPGVSLSAAQSSSGVAGFALTYVFTVTNTGDFPDEFTLELSSTWAASLPGGNNTGTLDPAQRRTISVIVDIPEGIPEGVFDILTLTAISALDSNVRASTTATTTVRPPEYIFLPTISR